MTEPSHGALCAAVGRLLQGSVYLVCGGNFTIERWRKLFPTTLIPRSERVGRVVEGTGKGVVRVPSPWRTGTKLWNL